ncbi:MAG: glycosyltransferase [Bacteroidota bacterium]|nr:glycosyltransferase [Bacteroidota bacterium]
MSRRTIPVSLVLTTLNEARTIGAFLDSVASQSVLPREVVICDGGSTDGTVERIRERTEDAYDIVLIVEPGANIAAGRNAAVAAARSEIIAVSDAGCVLDGEWLERITAPLLEDPSITVVGGGYGYVADTPFERAAAAAEIAVEDLDPERFLPSSRSIAFRRSAWRDAGGYPESLTFAGEDTAFCLSLKRAGHTIHVETGARVAWRPRATLRAYILQHYLYGVGDGESGSKKEFYGKIAVKTAVGTLLLGLAVFHHPLWLAAASALCALYAARLHRLYRWAGRPLGTRAGALCLIAVKELSVMSGFLRGSVRRLFGR